VLFWAQGENLMAVEPLNHEIHKDLLEQIRDHLSEVQDYMASVDGKLTDQKAFQKEVLELLREIAHNTEP
jgi:hypothetical protein